MPPKNTVKEDKCIVCKNIIPKDRVGNAVTCRKNCSKVYNRIYQYVRSKTVNKHITENKILKKKLKVMWDGS